MNSLGVNLLQNNNQNFGHNLNYINTPNLLNRDNEVISFLNSYYYGIINNGWNSVLDLFDQNAVVTVKNTNVGNEYGLLEALAKEYIKRINLFNISVKWSLTDQNTIVINTFGSFQFVSLFGLSFNTTSFSETFILKINNYGQVKCFTHMLDF